jgi:hypothetical protein
MIHVNDLACGSAASACIGEVDIAKIIENNAEWPNKISTRGNSARRAGIRIDSQNLTDGIREQQTAVVFDRDVKSNQPEDLGDDSHGVGGRVDLGHACNVAATRANDEDSPVLTYCDVRKLLAGCALMDDRCARRRFGPNDSVHARDRYKEVAQQNLRGLRNRSNKGECGDY